MSENTPPTHRIEDAIIITPDEMAILSHYRMIKAQGRGGLFLEMDEKGRFTKYNVAFGGSVQTMNALLMASGVPLWQGE